MLTTPSFSTYKVLMLWFLLLSVSCCFVALYPTVVVTFKTKILPFLVGPRSVRGGIVVCVMCMQVIA